MTSNDEPSAISLDQPDGEGVGEARPADLGEVTDVIAPIGSDLEAAAAFDIDDRLSAAQSKMFPGGLKITVSFQAQIDWASGTKVRVQVVSHTTREGGDNRLTYNLLTNFAIVISTKKLGKTVPPLDTVPLEDDWPTYGLNVVGANLSWGKYTPGSPFAAWNNSVKLPFSGPHIIEATGEPRDNKTQRVAIAAYGGFGNGARWWTAEKAAIRGGS
jgi:hypothetical protein